MLKVTTYNLTMRLCIVTCSICGYESNNVVSPPNPDTPCPRCGAKNEDQSYRGAK